MQITESRLNSVGADWTKYAKEPVKMETNGSTVIYGFGSELATLRILAKYRDAKHVRHEYSESRQSWCVSLRVDGMPAR